MGYRSEVKYVLLFSNKEQLDTFKAHAQLTLNDDPTDVPSDILHAYDNESHYPHHKFPHRIYVTWEDIKWYPNYRWVKVQRDMMQFVSELPDCGYSFARVGEEQGDIETESSESVDSWDFIDVRTYVEWI